MIERVFMVVVCLSLGWPSQGSADARTNTAPPAGASVTPNGNALPDAGANAAPAGANVTPNANPDAGANVAPAAHPGAEPPKDAYQLAIQKGIEEYGYGNYAEAREQFRRAHALSANARTFRAIGMCEYELRQYPEAIRNLRQALASADKRLDGVMRSQAESLLKRAEEYAGEVRVRVQPAQAATLLDGEPVTVGAEPLLLSVGPHVLEFSAPGRASQRRTLNVLGNQRQTVDVALVPLGAAEPQPGPLATQQERPTSLPPLYKRWWLWTAVGVVVASVAVASAVYATRSSDPREVARGTSHTPVGFGPLQPPGVDP